MKVLLINGSPHEKGCTYTALSEIASELKECGIDSKIFHVGTAPVRGCMGCGGCAGKGRCIFEDTVNTAIEKASRADGFIFGSPVHYASAGGAVTSFLDRMFYAGKANMVYKPGAAVASCRRAGSTATLDQLNKYFTISNMPLVGSSYWNMVHGNTRRKCFRIKKAFRRCEIWPATWPGCCIVSKPVKKRGSPFRSRKQEIPPTSYVDLFSFLRGQ